MPGMNIRDANPKILEDLRSRHLLLGATEIIPQVRPLLAL